MKMKSLCSACICFSLSSIALGNAQLFDVSLTDLIELDHESVASFAHIEKAKVPASVISISHETFAG